MSDTAVLIRYSDDETDYCLHQTGNLADIINEELVESDMEIAKIVICESKYELEVMRKL